MVPSGMNDELGALALDRQLEEIRVKISLDQVVIPASLLCNKQLRAVRFWTVQFHLVKSHFTREAIFLENGKK